MRYAGALAIIAMREKVSVEPKLSCTGTCWGMVEPQPASIAMMAKAPA